MKLTFVIAASALLAAPAFADGHGGPGDAAKGEREFRTCAACHSIIDPEGETLAGRGAKTGPNLYGIIGRTAGTNEDFKYRPALPSAGEAGLVFSAENIGEYIADPTAYLREFTGDDSLRSAMAKQRVRNIEDLVAFLASHSPVMEMEEESDS